MEPENTNNNNTAENKPSEGLSKEEKQMMEEQQRMLEHQENVRLNQEMQEDIRKQMEEESPLVGEKREISMMLDEFLNNEGFYVKVQKMHEKYQHYRKTRRDGSCFYRAFTFCILEHIFVKKDASLQKHMV